MALSFPCAPQSILPALGILEAQEVPGLMAEEIASVGIQTTPLGPSPFLAMSRTGIRPILVGGGGTASCTPTPRVIQTPSVKSVPVAEATLAEAGVEVVTSGAVILKILPLHLRGSLLQDVAEQVP